MRMTKDSRIPFENFKSSVCHHLKRLGDIDFIIEVLESDEITEYYNLGWYPECLYMLAMLDYLSRVNKIPLCNKYDFLRRCRLSETVYPTSIIIISLGTNGESIREQAKRESIPEFIRFNIVKNDVRDIG